MKRLAAIGIAVLVAACSAPADGFVPATPDATRTPEPARTAATSPAPTASPAAQSQAPTQSPVAAATRVPTPATTELKLAGWRGNRLVLLEVIREQRSDGTPGEVRSTFVLEYDVGRAAWRTIGLPPPFDATDSQIATDGTSIALLALGQVLVIDGDGGDHLFAPDGDPPIISTWGMLGLRPRPAGGYVVVGVEWLYQVLPDPWRLEDERIPPRYAVVAPTNHEGRPVLAPYADRVQPNQLEDPFRTTVWAPDLSVAARIATHPRTWRVDASDEGLVYARTLRGWILIRDVTERGAVEEPIAVPDVPDAARQFQSLSPGGRLVSVDCGADAPRPALLRGRCSVLLASGEGVAVVPEMSGGSVFGLAWSRSNRLAALVGSDVAHALPHLVLETDRGVMLTVDIPIHRFA